MLRLITRILGLLIGGAAGAVSSMHFRSDLAKVFYTLEDYIREPDLLLVSCIAVGIFVGYLLSSLLVHSWKLGKG